MSYEEDAACPAIVDIEQWHGNGQAIADVSTGQHAFTFTHTHTQAHLCTSVRILKFVQKRYMRGNGTEFFLELLLPFGQ